jgi:hypothetical protein
MPYPRHKTFQIWKECPRCGLHWPQNQLSRDHTGAKVCPECWDQEGHSEELRKLHLRTEEMKSDEQLEPIL